MHPRAQTRTRTRSPHVLQYTHGIVLEVRISVTDSRYLANPLCDIASVLETHDTLIQGRENVDSWTDNEASMAVLTNPDLEHYDREHKSLTNQIRLEAVSEDAISGLQSNDVFRDLLVLPRIY